MRNTILGLFFVLISLFSIAQEKVSSEWYGNYSLNFSRKRSYAPTMYWEHNFNISKDSCNYEGSGFQFYTKYKCYIKENKDTLFVYAKTYQDGYESYDKNELIIKMYKFKNLYYTKTATLKPEEALNKSTKLGYRVSKNENK